MPGLTVKVLLQDIKKLPTEALIVGFYENIRPLKGLAGELDWLLCGSLSNLIIEKRLRGSFGDMALLTSRGKVPAQKIFMVGLGPQNEFSPSSMRGAARAAVTGALAAGVKAAALEYFQPPGMSYDIGVPALQQGLSEAAQGRDIDIALIAPDPTAYEKMARLVNQ